MEPSSPFWEGILCRECYGNWSPEVSAATEIAEKKISTELAQRLEVVEDVCRELLSSRIAEADGLKRLLQLLPKLQPAPLSGSKVTTELPEVTIEPERVPKVISRASIINQVVALEKRAAAVLPMADTLKAVFGCGPSAGGGDASCLARCVESGSPDGITFTAVAETGKGKALTPAVTLVLDLQYRQARRSKSTDEALYDLKLKRIGFGRPDDVCGLIESLRKSVLRDNDASEWVFFQVQDNSSSSLSLSSPSPSPSGVSNLQAKTKSRDKKGMMVKPSSKKMRVDDTERSVLASPSAKKKLRTDNGDGLSWSNHVISLNESKIPSESRILEDLQKDAQDNPQAERILRSSYKQ